MRKAQVFSAFVIEVNQLDTLAWRFNLQRGYIYFSVSWVKSSCCPNAHMHLSLVSQVYFFVTVSYSRGFCIWWQLQEFTYAAVCVHFPIQTRCLLENRSWQHQCLPEEGGYRLILNFCPGCGIRSHRLNMSSNLMLAGFSILGIREKGADGYLILQSLLLPSSSRSLLLKYVYFLHTTLMSNKKPLV